MTVRSCHRDILVILPLIYLHTPTVIMGTKFITWRLKRSLRIKPEVNSANSWNLRVILLSNSNLLRAARVQVISIIRIWSRHKVTGDTPLSWKVSTKISRPSLLTKARVKLPDMYMVVLPLMIHMASVLLWVPIKMSKLLLDLLMFHRLEPAVMFSRMAVPEEAFKSPLTKRCRKIIRVPTRILTRTARRHLLPNMEGLRVPAKTTPWHKELADQPRRLSPIEFKVKNLSTLTMQISELACQINRHRSRSPERRDKIQLKVWHLVRISWSNSRLTVKVKWERWMTWNLITLIQLTLQRKLLPLEKSLPSKLPNSSLIVVTHWILVTGPFLQEPEKLFTFLTKSGNHSLPKVMPQKLHRISIGPVKCLVEVLLERLVSVCIDSRVS